MKILITLILLIALLQAAQSQNVGYLVVTDTGKKITAVKALKLIEVYAIAETVFPCNCIDFEKELNKSPFIEIRSCEKSVYIEKKQVTKNGKFKRIRK